MVPTFALSAAERLFLMKEVEKVDGGTMAAAASAAVIKPTIPVAYANTAPEQQSGHTNKEKLNVTTSVVVQWFSTLRRRECRRDRRP